MASTASKNYIFRGGSRGGPPLKICFQGGGWCHDPPLEIGFQGRALYHPWKSLFLAAGDRDGLRARP